MLVCSLLGITCTLFPVHVISSHTNVSQALWLEHCGPVVADAEQCLFFLFCISSELWSLGGWRDSLQKDLGL